MLTLTLALLLNAQTTPYLMIPRTRPELRSSASSSVSSVPAALQEYRKTVLTLVNQERKKRGLGSLKANSLLDRSAQAHADDMVRRKFFSHETPDKKKPEDRIRATGYFARPCPETECAVTFSYGENIARGQKSARDVMAAWMKSKIHRDNILKPAFTELGLGFAGGLWVQNFGGISVVRP